MSGLWCSVSAWRWDVIAGVSGVLSTIATLLIVYYLNIFELGRRRRKLMHPGTASFIIPSSLYYVCDYAFQNELEHIVHTIVVYPHSEIVVDLILRPFLEFDTTETAFGCDGDLFAKPYAFEYCNQFIVAGHRRNVIPGLDTRYDDYLDKHHYYHTVENPRFNAGDLKAMGFKIRTLSAGTYNMKIFFSGSTMRGEFRGLTIVVSDALPDLMRCDDPDHQHRDCAVRIRPRVTGAP